MNKIVFGALAAIGLGVSVPAMAQTVFFEGPQPVARYTVCNHNALFAANTRGVPVARGGRFYTNNGVTAEIGRTPDVFIQTTKLVRNAYQSLAPAGDICR